MLPLGRAENQKNPFRFRTQTDRVSLNPIADAGTIRVPQKIETHLDRYDTSNRLVTTALLLAAGTGTRLRPLTHDAPKCLTQVCGIPILARLVTCLVEQGFKRLVVMVGHHGDQIREYLDLHACGLEVHCIDCLDYATTNNIYSLWLARRDINEPFVLIESDLVFDSRLLGLMRTSNRIAIARFHASLNGTTVSFDDNGHVTSFRVGAVHDTRLAYKTVNLYSLSLPIWHQVVHRLNQRIEAGLVHDYYEVVFAEMASEGLLPLQGVHFDDGRWCEIDTTDDLLIADRLFAEPRETVGMHREEHSYCTD